MLEIVDLRVKRGGVDVLCGATLTARDGEVTALLGCNGSGKSTLLSAALGMIPANCQRCAVDGEALLLATARRRAQLAAYLPQRARIDGGLTALEAVLMGANARVPLFGGYSAAERAKAEACLSRVRAAQWANRTMDSLSEGQRQSVLFARAMMQDPRTLLLDEPDGALDLPRRWAMMAQVRAMVREGRAALVALHDADLALNTCDVVLTLRDGRIAGALRMHDASGEEIEAAMRALYGPARVFEIEGGWAVLMEGTGREKQNITGFN